VVLADDRLEHAAQVAAAERGDWDPLLVRQVETQV
jgi:hypothetical protein